MLSRPRIERLLDAAWERRVTLVVAGGGYGKTTALRRLAADKRARWLGLTTADREVEALAARVADALGAGGYPASTPTVAPIGASDRRSLAEGRVAVICEGLDTSDDDFLLILDDVDQLEDEDSATQFLSTLCLQAPSRLHVALGGRRLPPLRLGSARGRGELIELNAADLAFTLDETAALLEERLGLDARPFAEQCWSLTGGWAAALQLIADRLERLAPGRWREVLEQLRLRHGSVWREFAAELIDREQPGAQRILAVASVCPIVDGRLLSGLGIARPEPELESLQARGLLVAAGEPGARTLSPVLAEAVAERVAPADTQELRQRAVRWLEESGRLEEALECALDGSPDALGALVRRRGGQLIARGYGSRVVEVLRGRAAGAERGLDTVLAEALVAVGDWDGAIEVFRTIRHDAAGAPLDPGVAWRFGALLYLRSDIEAAQEVLSAAYREEGRTGDAALVAAWLSSTLWGRGETDQADRVAAVAVRQAETSGDAAALAAAHVAAALVAAGQGARVRNERHYRLALGAAAKAGDSVQLARIHANLSSRAAEEGDYVEAIREADLAISEGAGHNLFSALAMSNKGEALMHRGELEEARALLLQAIEMFTSLGSLMVCAPYTQLAALDAERGDLARARASLERAQRLAAEADDVHSLVFALAGLAVLRAEDDLESARRDAIEAAERATSLERAHALCARSWVELTDANHLEAVRLSDDAEAEARRTGDHPSLARALELGAAARQPPDESRLEAAAALWREIGDPIATRRAELALAACQGDGDRVAALREELSRRGVQPESGVAGVLLATQASSAEVAIATLGRFTVSRAGQPIPLAAWQSRKARDLLKMLAARRGRPLTRDAAAEALWPNEDAGPLPNRLSVALSTLRKVLDPDRSYPQDHFIAGDHQSLALRVDRVRLDVSAFLGTATAAVALASDGDWSAAERKLRHADSLYTGDFLEEDLYEDWAVDCREEARSTAQEVSRLLARAAAGRGDDEDAARHLRRLLERDPYDADAWTALLGAQLRLRRYGEARRQHAVYARRMAELEISPVPLARTLDARP